MIDIQKILKAYKIIPIENWNNIVLNYRNLTVEDIKTKILSFCFNIQGVYVYIDNTNKNVLYVGKSVNIANRLIQHYKEYTGPVSWDKKDIFHNFFKNFDDVIIFYFETKNKTEQTLIEVMLQDHLKHNFQDYYKGIKRDRVLKNNTQRLENRIPPDLKNKITECCDKFDISLSELFRNSLDFNKKFIPFRDLLIETYSSNPDFFIKFKEYIEKNSHIKNTIYAYFFRFEQEIQQSKLFRVLKLNVLNDVQEKEPTITKYKNTERIDILVSHNTLQKLLKQCSEKRSEFIRKIVGDYIDSISIFSIFSDVRFLGILPESLIKKYETFSEERFFTIKE